MRAILLRIAVPLTLLAVTSPASAQSFWLEPAPNRLSLELLRPGIDGVDLSLGSFVSFTTLSISVSEKVVLVGELPFSAVRPDVDGAETSTALGNPYIGFETLAPADGGFQLGGGVRLPVTSDEPDAGSAQYVGAMASASDRWEAFLRDVLGLQVRGRYVAPLGSGGYASGRLGLMVDRRTGGGDDTNTFLLYGARAWIDQEALRAGIGFSGRTILEGDGSPGERSLWELGLWADYAFGRLRPGVRVQVPVGENLSDSVDQVIGLVIQYDFP